MIKFPMDVQYLSVGSKVKLSKNRYGLEAGRELTVDKVGGPYVWSHDLLKAGAVFDECCFDPARDFEWP